MENVRGKVLYPGKESVGLVTKEREDKRRELLEKGWSLEMIDRARAKVDYYRHAPMLTTKGTIAKTRDGIPTGDVGKPIPNQNADVDTALRLSRRGIYPWPPSADCSCKTCREAYGTPKGTGKYANFRPQDVVTLAKPKVTPQPGEPSSLDAKIEEAKAEVAVLEKKTARVGQIICETCGWQPKGKVRRPSASLSAHTRHKHPR